MSSTSMDISYVIVHVVVSLGIHIPINIHTQLVRHLSIICVITDNFSVSSNVSNFLLQWFRQYKA